jgi:hypothetical protein
MGKDIGNSTGLGYCSDATVTVAIVLIFSPYNLVKSISSWSELQTPIQVVKAEIIRRALCIYDI